MRCLREYFQGKFLIDGCSLIDTHVAQARNGFRCGRGRTDRAKPGFRYLSVERCAIVSIQGLPVQRWLPWGRASA